MRLMIKLGLIPVFLAFSSCSNLNPADKQPNNITLSQDKYKLIKSLKVGKSPHGIAFASGYVFNSNFESASVSVIDTETDQLIKTIELEGRGPAYITPFHDQKNLLILDTKKGEALIIDALEHVLIQTIPVGERPEEAAVSADDKSVFISLLEENKIIQLNFSDDRSIMPKIKEISIGKAKESVTHPSMSVWKNNLLISNTADNNVSLINLNDYSEKFLADGNIPGPVSFGLNNQEAEYAIFGNTASSTISIFPLPDGEKTTVRNVGLSPSAMAVYQEKGLVFTSMSGSNEVSVIDYNQQKLIKKIKVGSRPLHIYSRDNEIWVSNDTGDSVSVIDADSLSLIKTIKVGSGHHKIAFTEHKAYVSNISSGDISIISRKN